MTLPLVGPFDGSEIRAELRQSGGNIVPTDATMRWLANEPTGPVDYPTDWFGKTAVRQEHAQTLTGASASYSTTAQLGIDYGSVRRFVVCVGCLGSAVASQLLVTSASLGGVALTQGPGQAWFNPGANTTMGIFTGAAGAISGTSGTFAINFNQSASRVRFVVYSISNIPTIHQQNQNGSASGTTTSTTVNVVANGVVVACCLKANCPAGNLTLSGVTEDTDIEPSGNVRFATGFLNRLGVQSNRSIGMTGTGAADIVSIAAMSFS